MSEAAMTGGNVRFGIGPFTCQGDVGAGPGAGRLQSDVVRFARTVEEEGLDGIWFSEHHLADDGYTG